MLRARIFWLTMMVDGIVSSLSTLNPQLTTLEKRWRWDLNPRLTEVNGLPLYRAELHQHVFKDERGRMEDESILRPTICNVEVSEIMCSYELRFILHPQKAAGGFEPPSAWL